MEYFIRINWDWFGDLGNIAACLFWLCIVWIIAYLYGFKNGVRESENRFIDRFLNDDK